MGSNIWTDIWGDVNPLSIDHSLLSGLTTGDAGHTQFTLLAGRPGGQIIYGGTGTSENLELRSTSHATKGVVRSDNLEVAANSYVGDDSVAPTLWASFGHKNFNDGVNIAIQQQNDGRVYINTPNYIQLRRVGNPLATFTATQHQTTVDIVPTTDGTKKLGISTLRFGEAYVNEQFSNEGTFGNNSGNIQKNEIVAVLGGNLEVFSDETLGGENLNEGDFTTSTKWTTSGDLSIVSQQVSYTHSTGSGTLEQSSGNLAIALKSERNYVFQFDNILFTGATVMKIRDDLNNEVIQIPTNITGTNKIIFKTTTTHTNFKISITSTETATLVLDNFSLKELQAGDIIVNNNIEANSYSVQGNAGASGTFTTSDAKTVTVLNGIITSIV